MSAPAPRKIKEEAAFAAIRQKAALGRYLVKGGGVERRLPGFADLVFVPRPLSPPVFPAQVNTRVRLGGRYSARPLDLAMPIMIAAMSFGALSKPAKVALAQGSALAGTATNTGEGGMLPEERAAAKWLIYQCLPGRYGWNIRDMLKADGLELLISQGAKPGLGGHLMAEKITPEIAAMRGLPPGIDLRSPSRHPDILGADDLVIKIQEFREAVDGQIPVSLKLALGRIRDDIRIAANVEADFVQLDGMQGATGAAPEISIENIGIPTMAGLAGARQALTEIGWQDRIDLTVMGGIRDGADIAKALALGAKAVNLGMGVLMALGCTGCRQCYTGRCPQGIATQNPELTAKLDIAAGAQRVCNYLTALNQEVREITAALGKTDIAELGRRDLAALTPDASAMTGLPLAGSARVF
ncbi:MAG: FMN-binding glutamate synthase family protein [Deltaproteobacteria bacterium]|nr:FMN-binding glutamate synthase family protein [Deltaproteobacteria bacterium]